MPSPEGSRLCHISVSRLLSTWMTIENLDCEEECRQGEREGGRKRKGERQERNIYLTHTYCVGHHARCFGNIHFFNSQTNRVRWYGPYWIDGKPEALASYSSICRERMKSWAFNPDPSSLLGRCPSHNTHGFLEILPLPPLLDLQ